MSSEEAAAPTKTVTDDDGMSWWYRWICKLAGVLGGICKYHVTVAICYLIQNNSICHVFPDRQLKPQSHVTCWTSTAYVKVFTVTSLPLKQSCTIGFQSFRWHRPPNIIIFVQGTPFWNWIGSFLCTKMQFIQQNIIIIDMCKTLLQLM